MNTEWGEELITVTKLRQVHAVEPAVLSLYLNVPLDPAELRGLPARAGELMAAAGGPADGGPGRLRDTDRAVVRAKVEAHSRDCLGRTVAIFACADAGLLDVLRLRCDVRERAVLAARPHIRPLLAALQWCPDYRVAVVDRRHAWVFSVSGDEIETVVMPPGAEVASRGFGGWYGLDSYHAQQRVIELAHQHNRDMAALLERLARHSAPRPLVIGGHEEGIRELLAVLPQTARGDFAGSFAADLRSLTPARVRDLAAPVVARWADLAAQRLATEILQNPSRGLAAAGLSACLAAVNTRALAHLVVLGDGLVPGHACARCGWLGSVGVCPDCAIAAQPVPDLIDEMAHRTLDDGGQVSAVRADAVQVAAWLRFPAASQ